MNGMKKSEKNDEISRTSNEDISTDSFENLDVQNLEF
jgi:hypothetical protein